MADISDAQAAVLAKRFHEAYESLAPEFGYKTREASAVPWEDVPEPNRQLMMAVMKKLHFRTARDTNSVHVMEGWIAQ